MYRHGSLFMGLFIAGTLTLWVVIKILKGKKNELD